MGSYLIRQELGNSLGSTCHLAAAAHGPSQAHAPWALTGSVPHLQPHLLLTSLTGRGNASPEGRPAVLPLLGLCQLLVLQLSCSCQSRNLFCMGHKRPAAT